MALKADFVAALLSCCPRVYPTSQSPNQPVYDLILYEQVQDKPIVFADNKVAVKQVVFWVYFYGTKSLDSLEKAVDDAMPDYFSKLVKEQNFGTVLSKIKEYTKIEESDV